ncbi:hypothetical protein EVG20_g8211 [Dentipellis fragilis]|uniref:Uncharacterized protein n=1 Tax=Dentipellis fragilis TaxID=205917 RepID=A0A4Y9Y9P0_9AGAM|nr:hypothetical protein EVG20_g8211 [Dentipellis fragilis]
MPADPCTPSDDARRSCLDTDGAVKNHSPESTPNHAHILEAASSSQKGADGFVSREGNDPKIPPVSDFGFLYDDLPTQLNFEFEEGNDIGDVSTAENAEPEPEIGQISGSREKASLQKIPKT